MFSDDGCRQDHSSRSRHRPPWLRQQATAGHNGEKPGPTAVGSERSYKSCLSGSAFLQCDWSISLSSLAADTTENWLQDCHDYTQSQTDQHTSLHSIIDQWLHPIKNFTIMTSYCCLNLPLLWHFFKRLLLLAHLLSGTDIRYTVDLLQLLNVLNTNSKRHYLLQHTVLSSHCYQRLWYASWHTALYKFLQYCIVLYWWN